MAAKKQQARPKAKRRRVQIDLTPEQWALLAEPHDGTYHRGRHLIDLMLLGLAAKLAGLTCQLEGGTPMLRGRNTILLGLDASPPAQTAVGAPEVPLAVSVAQDIVLPTDFLSQF